MLWLTTVGMDYALMSTCLFQYCLKSSASCLVELLKKDLYLEYDLPEFYTEIYYFMFLL